MSPEVAHEAPVATHTHNEWDPLRAVIVGSATGAQIPTVRDVSLHCVNYGLHSDEEFARIRTGPYPQRVIEETNEDLDAFAEGLERLGIRVFRPPETDFTRRYETEDWSVDGYYAYCPRDSILTVGEWAIETPMALRHRQREATIYRQIVSTVRCPRPRLLDELYDRSQVGVPTLRESEPVFDAANCLKLGRDILYLISNTGNEAGADWLQEFLGSDYRVRKVRDIYAFIHVDSTIMPLRPGLLLLNPERVSERNLPEWLASWDKIYMPEPVEVPCAPEWNPCSKWIAMNVLSLGPDLVAVEERQVGLIRLLEQRGITPFPVRLRHMRTLAGGAHCATLDLVRDGGLEDYF